MDSKEVWISTLAVANLSLLKQPGHPGNSQSAMTVWTLSNHSQCCSLSLALRAGHYVDSPHSLTLWKWLIAQRGADTVVWWMADANHKFCCVVNPQSALLPQSCILWVIPWHIDFWKNIYYEEKIVFVGKSKWKKTYKIARPMLLHSTLLRSALLPLWLVMRFTSLTIWTTLHCNWHWESVGWRYCSMFEPGYNTSVWEYS